MRGCVSVSRLASPEYINPHPNFLAPTAVHYKQSVSELFKGDKRKAAGAKVETKAKA